MKLLFISKYYYPHIGGVETHSQKIAEEAMIDGNSVSVVTSKYNNNLKDVETVNGVKVLRIPIFNIKFFGLIAIWFNLFKNIKLIYTADIIHIHDVFIWFLPFIFLFPNKKVFVTNHGWEGVYPIPVKNKIIKKLSKNLSDGVIAVGRYIDKYYEIKSDYYVYGAPTVSAYEIKKQIYDFLYIGRLEKDTGLTKFIEFLKNKKDNNILFLGDGSLRTVSTKYGKVSGFVKDTGKYILKSKTVVPSGYLTYINADYLGRKIITFSDNPLKDDYWKEIKKYKYSKTWKEVYRYYKKIWKKI